MRLAACLLLLMSLTAGAAAQASAAKPAQSNQDWKAVDEALGRTAQDQPDGTHKFSMPRRDLNVTAGGVNIKPGLALGSWAAFRKMGEQGEVMGDLVLTEDEVPAVMQKLQEGNIEITALHNHLLHESPRVMYMHIHGRGEATALAKTLHDALAATKTPAGAPAPPQQQQDLGIDTKQIDAALGQQGKNNGGIYQVAVPRAEQITESSANDPMGIRDSAKPIPASMGLATSLNFQPTGGGKAAITGDFVLTAKEVNPVIKALRENGIAVTALHSHMLEEQPRLFFMHFWANDDAVKLAKGLRAALDQTNSKK